MKKLLLVIFSLSFLLTETNAQELSVDSTEKIVITNSATAPIIIAQTADILKPFSPAEFMRFEDKAPSTSPYKTSWRVDAPIIAGGVGLTLLGTALIKKKHDLTDAEVLGKRRENLPFFDRGNAGLYSLKADKDSYVPFHASFVAPVLVSLLNSNERNKFGQVMVLYVETMAITGAMFTMAAGTVYRSRPYVYNPAKAGSPDVADMDRKRDSDSHRSFFAGHTAATAAASFYTAKVFADFNPDSKLKPYVWALAAATPALVGYLRYKAGMHFLSDNILGYVLGAGAGILVPELHKTKLMKNVSVTPHVGLGGNKGLAITYNIR
ncbi:MAG: PA-phosphatase [Segetibacter sp.]|nr:PA-phosphatase [Segetibacter sp.]